MAVERRPAVIDGILPVDKPLGWTSHDVVARVRRVAVQRPVGHAGTLDPLASGVLLLVLGSATRMSSYLMDTAKTYCAEVVLGARTVTDDGGAPLLPGGDWSRIRDEDIEAALRGFVGTIQQVPPAYAAVRVNGERMYRLARKGEAVDAPPRTVEISDLTVIARDGPRVRLLVRCGSGTYIRSLARDLGAVLDVGAYLHALRRVSSGTFSVDDCVPLDALRERIDVERAVVPLDRAVAGWDAVILCADQTVAVGHGLPIEVSGILDGGVRLYDGAGQLVALGHGSQGTVRPFRVFRRME